MFDSETHPSAFNEQAICGPQRHGFPWRALLQLAFDPGLAPRADDPFYQRIANDKRDLLRGRFAQLKDEACKLIPTLQAAGVAGQKEQENNIPVAHSNFYTRGTLSAKVRLVSSGGTRGTGFLLGGQHRELSDILL